MSTLSEIRPEELVDAPPEIVSMHMAMQMLQNLNIEDDQAPKIVIRLVIHELKKALENLE